MKIGFVLPVPTQPRFWKRIEGLIDSGDERVVWAFERDYLNRGGARLDYIPIGSLVARQYWRRLPALVLAIVKLAKQIKSIDVLYCFGTDLALIGLVSARLAGRDRLPVVLERGDIGPALVRSSAYGRMLRWAERLVLDRCALIVVTSPEYVNSYFVPHQEQDKSKCLVMENKLVSLPGSRESGKRWDGSRPLRIGYFGILRDPVSWDVLVGAVRKAKGAIELHVYGRVVGIPRFSEDIALGLPIYFYGEYRWPDDLEKLYGSVDIVWACFPKTQATRCMGLWRWPMTNRFYESCGTGTPMISQAGSVEGRRVETLGIGAIVDTDDPDQCYEVLLSITPEKLLAWKESMMNVPIEMFVYGHEHAQLRERLSFLAEG